MNLSPLHHHDYYVKCEDDDCPNKPETRGLNTEAQAAEEWNTRFTLS